MKAPVPIPSLAPRPALAVALAAVLPLAACEDPFGSSQPLPAEATTVSIGDFQTAPLGESTAFQLSNGRTVRPSQVNDWDFVFWVTGEEQPQLRPRDMITSGDSDAGLSAVEVAFGSLEEAPEDGYVTDEPVPADSGAVYAVRSRQAPNLGLQCRRYAKVEVLSVDPEAKTVTFRHLINPNCESRNLVAGSGGEDG